MQQENNYSHAHNLNEDSSQENALHFAKKFSLSLHNFTGASLSGTH